MLSKSALPTEIVVKISHDHILHIDADTTVQGQRLLRGDVITTINGHKSHEITTEALKLIPGELPAYRLYNLQQEFAQFYSILYPKEKTYDLQIKRGKTTLRIKLDGTEYSKRDKQHRPSYAYHALNDSIYLFEFNCCDMDGVEKFMRRMSDSLNRADVRHLIIDVRHNSGGNSRAGDEVCRYITDKAFTGFNGLQYKLSKTLCKEYGQKFENDSVQEYWLNEYDKVLPYDKKYRFKGKTYLLQGPETFSSAANFTAAYKEYVPGLIIGEESGGVNICAGDIIGPKLPETQLIILIPWKVFYEAGSNPGDEVHGTIPDIVTEADKALDEAIRTITEI